MHNTYELMGFYTMGIYYLKNIVFVCFVFLNILPSISISEEINNAVEQRKTLDSIKYFSNGGINVEAYIKFNSGKKEIAHSSKEFLNKIAKKLADLEYEIFEKSGSEKDTIFIDIVGHTDDEGTAEDNMVLSENRAISVYNFLIDYGFTEDKMRARGKGEKNPKYSNGDYWGKWHNRRVDLKVTRRKLIIWDI